MTWTYVAPTTDRDKVRFLIGDTDTTDQLITDEEIAFLLTEYNNIYDSAIAASETLFAKFNRLADSTSKSVGDISVSESYSSKASQYKELANALTDRKFKKYPIKIYANPDSLKSTDDRNITDYHTDAWVGIHDNPNQALDTRRLD